MIVIIDVNLLNGMNICYCASWLSKCPVIHESNCWWEQKINLPIVWGIVGLFGVPFTTPFLHLPAPWVLSCRPGEGNSRVQPRRHPNLPLHRCWMLRMLQPQPHQDRLMIYFNSPLWNSSIISNFNDHSFDPQNRGIYSSS